MARTGEERCIKYFGGENLVEGRAWKVCVQLEGDIKMKLK
jgi:hypothetical protein